MSYKGTTNLSYLNDRADLCLGLIDQIGLIGRMGLIFLLELGAWVDDNLERLFYFGTLPPLVDLRALQKPFLLCLGFVRLFFQTNTSDAL